MEKLTKKEIFKVIVLVLLISSIAGFLGWYTGFNRLDIWFGINKNKSPKDILYVNDLIKTYYYKDVDETSLIDKTISSLIKSLDDPYSYFLSKEEYAKEIEKEKGPVFEFRKLDGDIGYLKVLRFGSNLKEEFEKIKNEILQLPSKKLIIDLRNNLGGKTEMALYLLNQFVNEGLLFSEELTTERLTHNATRGAPLKDIIVLILTNKKTSSAAEQFVSAFKENQRAKIVGEKTYGKGVVGNYFELGDRSAIQLIIGKWLTKSGDWIEGKGISPDIEISDDPNTEKDEVVEKANEIF